MADSTCSHQHPTPTTIDSHVVRQLHILLIGNLSPHIVGRKRVRVGLPWLPSRREPVPDNIVKVGNGITSRLLI